jgi:hypothetical protein
VGKRGDMNEEVIRTKRIELYDDQDNLTGVLDGGVTIEDGERSQAGLILYGPDGPGSFASISMHGESGRPSIRLHTVGDGDIIIYFNNEGKVVIRMVNEDGTAGELIPE